MRKRKCDDDIKFDFFGIMNHTSTKVYWMGIDGLVKRIQDAVIFLLSEDIYSIKSSSHDLSDRINFVRIFQTLKSIVRVIGRFQNEQRQNVKFVSYTREWTTTSTERSTMTNCKRLCLSTTR